MDIFSPCDDNRSASDHLFTRCAVVCPTSASLQICFEQSCYTNEAVIDFRISIRNPNTTSIPYYDSRTIVNIAETSSGRSVYPTPRENTSRYGSEESSEHCTTHALNELVYQRRSFSKMTCQNSSSLECQFSCERLVCLTDFDPNKHRFETPFWSFLIIFLFGSVAYSPLTNLIDAMAYELIGEKKHIWGQQRVWGAAGFVTLALCSGPILKTVILPDGDSNYAVCFYIFGGFMMLTAAFAYLMNVPENFHCSNLMKFACKLLSDFGVVVFLLAIFLLGSFFGVINTFLFWYLMDLKQGNGDEGNENIIVALALFCASGMELPTIFFSGRIIKKFGEFACISMAFVGYVIRFQAYYLVQNAWHVLPFELLHGVTFGIMFPAATMYASKISPPGMSATMQGLLSGTHFGLGWGTGALIGGILYDCIGARRMFLACSVTSGVALVVFIILNLFVLKRLAGSKEAAYTVNNSDSNAGVQVRDLMSNDKENSGDEDDENVNETTVANVPKVENHV